MPATILGHVITVTKNAASGNFKFNVFSPNGAIQFTFALLSADMATAAALTSGNSATFTYGQDGSPAGPTRTDLDYSTAQETF